MKLYQSLCVCFFSLLLCNGTVAADGRYEISISKSSQKLKIMDGKRLVKQFQIAYGKGDKGTKRIAGDNKTPLGIYKIVKLKDSEKFHYFMQLDYPNLRDVWYGYKNDIIDATEFHRITTMIKNNDIPPQNTKLGGYIGIHGLGDTTEQKLTIHNELNWTEGCIAMTNEEINDLMKYVRIGTKVIIQE